jgi:hypothetical protein
VSVLLTPKAAAGYKISGCTAINDPNTERIEYSDDDDNEDVSSQLFPVGWDMPQGAVLILCPVIDLFVFTKRQRRDEEGMKKRLRRTDD